MDATGGSGNTGQITIGGDTRKLTKSEAGYRTDEGVGSLRCGDCRFFESGECQIVEGPIDADDVCDQYEQNTKDGNTMSSPAMDMRERPLSAIEMFITRVSKDKQTGERRWYATTSGVKKDLYGERMSVALYKDFIRRIEENVPAPAPFASDAWAGGLPYVSVAHYLDLDGAGIAGPATQVWIDGNTLKAKGTFNDTPLGLAAFRSIQEDIATKRADDERVRVSIAFIDWGHNHGKGENKTFTRKSLKDTCMLCEAGVGDKTYTAGQLVHFALTRRPAYPETEIVALEERSVSKRMEDAASIVGEELAEELENRSKNLIGRSGDGPEVASGAIVIKDETAGQEEAEVVERTLGGARTLDDAEAYLTKSAGGEPIPEPWEVLSVVLGNIAGEDHRDEVRTVLRDYRNTLDVQTAEAVLEIKRALGGESVSEKTKEVIEREVPPQFRKDKPEDEEEPRRPDEEEMDDEDMKKKSHPLDSIFAEVKDAFNTAMETPGDSNMRLGMIQQSFNTMGEEIRRMVEEATGSAPADAQTIQRAIEAAMAPVVAEMTSLRAEIAAGKMTERSVDGVPPRRAIHMPPASIPALGPPAVVTRSAQPTDDNPTPKLRDLVRKSTIGYEQQRGIRR
jgi:hypothetical protein